MKFRKIKISKERKLQNIADEKQFKKSQEGLKTTPVRERSWWWRITKSWWLISCQTLKPIQRAILVSLHLYAGLKSQCYPSTRKLAKDLGLNQLTILRNIKILEAKKFIKIQKKKGKFNTYILLK